MSIKPQICLVSPARNEGPFLLEWIAWHRMLGFDDIVILTHDCTDGSDRLLDLLEARGFIRHLRHHPDPEKPALHSAYLVARHEPGVLGADMVMALDTDEFLQVFIGDGSIHALVRENLGPALGMAIYWKVFGANGRANWQDGFLRHQFDRAADGQTPPNNYYKSVFRNLDRFRAMSSHSPRRFNGVWGGSNVWVDCNGEPLRAIRLAQPAKHTRATHLARVTHKAAQVNHYAVKSLESYALKSTRLSGAASIHRHDATFFKAFDCNAVTDTTACAREVEFAAQYDPLYSDPEIRAMHHACCAHYVAALCNVAGTDPKTDPRFGHHTNLAGKAFP